MNKLRIIRNKNNKIIGNKFKHYIIFGILASCSIIIFNIHPTKIIENSDSTEESKKIIYIFHDYDGNEYILNDITHGSADSLDFLFNKEVPDSIKGIENQHYSSEVSLANKGENKNNYGDDNKEIKDNQVSLGNIMSDLGIDSGSENNSDYLIISLGNNSENSNTQYKVKEETYEGDNSTLTIEKETYENNITEDEEISNETEELLNARRFEYTKDGRVLPSLVEWDEIQLNNKTITAYVDTNYNNESYNTNPNNNGIIIIDDYADCKTPRGYSIVHGDSVLAYKQIENAPDICNIERRYCWNGKLSGTYTQQGCSVNSNYTYNTRGEVKAPEKQEEIKGGARQNPDGTVTVKNDEIGGAFVFDKPNRSKTEFGNGDNVMHEEEGVEQTTRPYRDCTAPRGEKVKHGGYIQAFKHSNGFSDAPCEIQFRLCSMGELLGSYTESTCKARDTSFIDWINGSPTRETYSKEKLDLIKKRLKDEEKEYKNERKNATRSTDSVALDKILWILDQ